jgi:hypothetical protein
MEDQKDYFGTKPDQEILRNVATSVNDIVNQVVEEETTEISEKEEEINPLVDAVGKAIKYTKPKGLFMQGVSPEKTPKKS